MLVGFVSVLTLIAGRYLLAAALGLPWRTRMLTALALELIGGPAIAWATGLLAPAIRPDHPCSRLPQSNYAIPAGREGIDCER